MGLVDEVSETFKTLRDAIFRFLQLWSIFWCVLFFCSLAWFGVSAGGYTFHLMVPAFFIAGAWIFSTIEDDDDPAFRCRRSPYYGYVGRGGRQEEAHGDARHPPGTAPASSNRYYSASAPWRRPGAASSSSNYRSGYSASTSYDSPTPARSHYSNYNSSGVIKMRDNKSTVTSILKNVIFVGLSNRGALNEALAEMDRVDDECGSAARPPGVASISPHYMLLLKDDDLTQLRGIFKYMGDNRLRRVWGTFPNDEMTIEEIERHRSPEGAPSRQFKYQPATKYFEELPLAEGIFNENADAFTMPKFVPPRTGSRPTASRPPLAQANPNAGGGFGPARTTFAPKSSFTTSSASTGARIGPGGRANPYSSAYGSSSSNYTTAFGGSGSSAYSSSYNSSYNSGVSAYGSSYGNSNSRSTSAYGSFDDRPVGRGAMQEAPRVRDDDPYGRPPPVRKKAEMLEIAW